MARQSIGQSRLENKAENDMAADARIIHIEGRVDRLENDVSEIKTGVKELLSRPQNPGFNQVIVTLVATLTAAGIIFTFAKWHLFEAVEPLRKEISEIHQKFDASELRYQNSRLKTAVNIAVLNERSLWLQSEKGWNSRIEPNK